MGSKDTLAKEKVVYSGICNIKDLYNYAFEWLVNEGFSVLEEKYKESIKGDSKDIEIKWKANKKVDDFFKIHIEIGWKILGASDVEVDIEGTKTKMNKVKEIEISLKGILEQDHEGKWESSSFQKFLKETYTKYVIPDRKKEREDNVKDGMKNFAEEMKAFLQLTGKR